VDSSTGLYERFACRSGQIGRTRYLGHGRAASEVALRPSRAGGRGLRAAGKLGRPEDAARGRRRRIENAHARVSDIGVKHIAKVEKALVAGLDSASVGAEA
jgi:hypothetical protein